MRMHCVCDSMHPYMCVNMWIIACEVYVVCNAPMNGHSGEIYDVERSAASLLLIIIILATEKDGYYYEALFLVSV